MMTLEDRRAINRLGALGLDERPARCCGECEHWYGVAVRDGHLVNDQRDAVEGLCLHEDVREIVPAAGGGCPMYEGWLS